MKYLKVLRGNFSEGDVFIKNVAKVVEAGTMTVKTFGQNKKGLEIWAKHTILNGYFDHLDMLGEKDPKNCGIKCRINENGWLMVSVDSLGLRAHSNALSHFPLILLGSSRILLPTSHQVLFIYHTCAH